MTSLKLDIVCGCNGVMCFFNSQFYSQLFKKLIFCRGYNDGTIEMTELATGYKISDRYVKYLTLRR